MQPTFCDALVDHAAERYESHQTSDSEDGALRPENIVAIEDTTPAKTVILPVSSCAKFLMNELMVSNWTIDSDCNFFQAKIRFRCESKKIVHSFVTSVAHSFTFI